MEDRALVPPRHWNPRRVSAKRIEELLNARPLLKEFMENVPDAFEEIQLTIPPEERPGGRIGRYKLLQKLGEGGCGVVYLAEQEEPVRRRVALKVIKLGMDTRQVIAGALIQQEDGAPKAAIAKPDQVLSHPGKRNSWMLALIALVTLLLGVVIGFALK